MDTPQGPALLPDLNDYTQLTGRFRWAIPDRFNIATVVADRWAEADPDRPAILEQLDCTTVVEPGDKVRQDKLGNLLISVH